LEGRTKKVPSILYIHDAIWLDHPIEASARGNPKLKGGK